MLLLSKPVGNLQVLESLDIVELDQWNKRVKCHVSSANLCKASSMNVIDSMWWIVLLWVCPLSILSNNSGMLCEEFRFSGAIDHWPALTRWKDPQYLSMKAGSRTIPVEVGEHYLQEGWGQKLMLLSDFIANHLAAPQQVLWGILKPPPLNELLTCQLLNSNWCVLASILVRLVK